jgi:hypothetical protein
MYKTLKHWLHNIFKSEEQVVQETYKELMKEIIEANTFELLTLTKQKIKNFNDIAKPLYYQKWTQDAVNSLEVKWAIQFKLWKKENRG